MRQSWFHKFLVESKEDYFPPREIYASSHAEAAEILTEEFWTDYIYYSPECKDGRLDLIVTCLNYRGGRDSARGFKFVREGFVFIGNISGKPVFEEEIEDG